MSSQLTSQSLRRGLNARQLGTVEKLLIAGQEELREVGHEALTIRTVALRAGVSPATAYTYLASKHHLFAELFLRHIADDPDAEVVGGNVTERVQNAARGVVNRLVVEPELAAAVTPALLGSDPDVARLRLKIGAEFVARFEAALREPGEDGPVDPLMLEVLVLTLSGALLQAGMGVMTYDEMADRLDSAVAVIMRGNI
jgi:AcrR family transcriptional regulator